MASKTPLFDAALDKILLDLKPHTRVCIETGESFEITERDIEMLKLLRVPPPKTVWWAAIRRQRAFLAGYDLFMRPTVNGVDAISYYDPEAPVLVLGKIRWSSDEYSTAEISQPYRDGNKFFEQWRQLSGKVPRPAIMQYGRCENSDWCAYSLDVKDVYASYSSLGMEDCVYNDGSGWCKHSTEGVLSVNVDFSYDFTVCMRSNRLAFCERCDECVDVAFSLGCGNCSDCFGCTNLRNKKFCFLNEQLTEEEYRKRRAAIDLGDARVVAEWRKKMAPIWAEAFRRGGMVMKSEDAIGDDIEESRDVHGVSIRQSERSHGIFGVVTCKDTERVSWGMGSERIFNATDIYESSEVICSVVCQSCINVEYSELMWHCENCFGCIGLKYKKFCIFNVQYTGEEYWPMVDKIKTAMLERGEYGEFFPYALSSFAYNLSHSGMMEPLSKEEVQRLGARWYDAPLAPFDTEEISAIPEHIADVTDDIVKRRFRCPETGRAFFFVAPEIAMHKEMGIALPRKHPMVDRVRRTLQALPPKLFPRACGSCGKQLETRIPHTFTAPVLCQSCYEQVVLGEKEPPVIA